MCLLLSKAVVLVVTFLQGAFYCAAIVICEGKSKDIACPNGELIHIQEAKYGRTALGDPVCTGGRKTSKTCLHDVSITKLGCQLEPNCTLAPVNGRIYGHDPCPNQRKYLNISYTCIAETTTLNVPMSNVTSGNCRCPCYDDLQWKHLLKLGLTRTEMKLAMKNYLDSLVNNVTIDRKGTNRVLRMKTSAFDNRKSAKSIGCVGVAIIVTAVGLLVSSDALNLYNSLKLRI